MAYRFPLAAVLRLRESIETREERSLQSIQMEIVRVSRTIEELTAAIANAREAQERIMRQPAPAGHLHSVLWECQSAAHKRNALLNQLDSLKKRHGEQMQVYRAAHRDREMLSDLHARNKQAYEVEQARTQQKQMDDLFGARHSRNGRD
jgi:flagellar export protein FliJ